MPFPAILASLAPFAPAIGSALSGGLNMITDARNSRLQAQIARENTDKTIAYQKQAADTAYQRNLAQWNRANLYDSPQAQMSRLKDAGLNPMLVYGSGSPAGGSNASPTQQAPQGQYNYQASLAPRLPDLGQIGTNLALGGAQLENINAQTAAIKQKTANDAVHNFLLSVEAIFKRDNEFNKAGILKAQNKFIDAEKILGLQLQGVTKAVQSNALSQSKQMFPYQMSAMMSDIRAKDIGNRKLLQEINNLGLQGMQTEEQTKLIKLNQQIGEEDLQARKYQNALRKAGTYEGDNPLSYVLRQNAPLLKYFFEALAEQFIPNWDKKIPLTQEQADKIARDVFKHLDNKK